MANCAVGVELERLPRRKIGGLGESLLVEQLVGLDCEREPVGVLHHGERELICHGSSRRTSDMDLSFSVHTRAGKQANEFSVR